MNKETFEKAHRLTFAGALEAKLSAPTSVCLCPYHQDRRKAIIDPKVIVRVDGRLQLHQHGETGETVVAVSLRLVPDWLTLLPVVSTDAPFLRREPDWHVPIGNILCYSQNAEWGWKLNELWDTAADANEIMEFASSWCIRNVDSLITRHLHGHRHGIVKWPKQWDQWAHGENGIRECERFIETQKAA